MKIKPKDVEGGLFAAVLCWLLVCILSLLPISLALGDCPSPELPLGIAEPVREFYADMCRESDAPLAFALDAGVKSRLQLPSGGPPLNAEDIYPDRPMSNFISQSL
jgi:hypothetical protein